MLRKEIERMGQRVEELERIASKKEIKKLRRKAEAKG